MKISIITVCYNSSATISRTLNSIQSQSYKDYEVIIIDGNSTDNTLEIVEEFKDIISIVVSESDTGIYDALNKGINLSSGDVIAILHSNDFFASSDVLALVANSFKKAEAIKIIFTSINYVSNRTHKIIREFSPKNFRQWMLYLGLMPPHTGAFIRSEVYSEVGLYDTSYKIAGDFDFFVRALLLNHQSFKLNSLVSTSMMMGGASSSGLKSYLNITEEFSRSLSKNNLYSNKCLIFIRAFFKLWQFKLNFFLDR